MSRERIETGPAPALSVSCRGDLVIKGWSESAVGVRGDYELEESGKVWSISSKGDLVLHVPTDTALHVVEAAGDVVVKYSGGDAALDVVRGDLVLRGLSLIKADTVHGDLSVRHCTGPARFETIHGDMSASQMQELSIGLISGDISGRFINGPLTIETVKGDINLRTVNGPLSIVSGHRDANLSDINGTVTMPEIRGDIRLKGGLPAGNHVLQAQRDIILRWPSGMPVNLIAVAPSVSNRATLDEFEKKGDAWIGRNGDGKTNLELTAGKQIQIKDAEAFDPRWEAFDESDEDYEFAFDFGNLGERISAQVNEKIEQFTRNLEQQFGPEFGPEFGEKIARKAEQAAQKAERAAERAAQRAEKAAERARSQEQRGNRWQDFAPPPAAPPTPRSVSPEEQLKILRMVEKGTISPEEAGMLLEALES